MLKFFSKRMNKKGFTLIELIVVIAILGILLLIAVPRLAGFRESAAQKADKASAATIGNAVALHYANIGLSGITDTAGIDVPLYNGINADLKTMIADDGEVPKPQYSKGGTEFAAKVYPSGNVIVSYGDGTKAVLWPEGASTN